MSRWFLLISSFINTRSSSTYNRLSKKVIYPFLAMAIFLAILSGCGTDLATNLEAEIENNEQLTDQINELENNNSAWEEKYAEIEEQIVKLNEKIIELEDENKAILVNEVKIQEENKSLNIKNEELIESIDVLKSQNNELQKKVDEKKEASVSSKSSTKSTASNASKSTESTSQKSNTSVSSSAAKTTEVTQECNIKGSVNKIYHVPGSTYYSRTKNVVQWFCSTNEAQEAGYRAPAR